MLVSKIEISFYPRERRKHPIIQKCAFVLPLSIYIPHMRLDIKRKSTNAAESKTLQRIFNIQVRSSAYPFIPHIYTSTHTHKSPKRSFSNTLSSIYIRHSNNLIPFYPFLSNLAAGIMGVVIFIGTFSTPA